MEGRKKREETADENRTKTCCVVKTHQHYTSSIYLVNIFGCCPSGHCLRPLEEREREKEGPADETKSTDCLPSTAYLYLSVSTLDRFSVSTAGPSDARRTYRDGVGIEEKGGTRK